MTESPLFLKSGQVYDLFELQRIAASGKEVKIQED